MNIPSYVTTTILKVVFTQIIIPGAKQYVARTDNIYDDKFVEFIEALAEYLLAKLKT